jgi:hypothetical protein
MADSYKLVFRGEVLQGQHPAVVRKRLAEAGSFSDDQLDKLFSGRPVVVKRTADTDVAARVQSMFRNAGARLRVLPVDDENDAGDSADAAAEAEAQADSTPPAEDEAASVGGLQLLPAGSVLLYEHERTVHAPRQVDTSALSLEGASFSVAPAAPLPPAPDVSHLSLAEPGSDLSESASARSAAAPSEPAPDPQFEVAPAGVVLGQEETGPEPAAPDTSHLTLTPQ